MENAIKLFAAIGIAAGMIAAVLHEYQNLTSGKKSVNDFIANPNCLGRIGKINDTAQ
jgi:hypothetical protein